MEENLVFDPDKAVGDFVKSCNDRLVVIQRLRFLVAMVHFLHQMNEFNILGILSQKENQMMVSSSNLLVNFQHLIPVAVNFFDNLQTVINYSVGMSYEFVVLALSSDRSLQNSLSSDLRGIPANISSVLLLTTS